MDYGTKRINRDENPYEKASLISKFSFWWLKDIFKLGLNSVINEDNIYETLKSHDATKLCNEFEDLWESEKEKYNNGKNGNREPSLLRIILKIYGFRIFGLSFVYALILLITRICQPLCLGGLVSFFERGQTDITKNQAYFYAGGLILCCLIPVLMYSPFTLYIVQIGMKMRIACCSLVYKKTLKISKSVIVNGLAGKVINLMSNDASKFDTAIVFIQYLYVGPVEILVLGYFIYKQIGIAGIIGIGFMLCVVPLQIWMGKTSGTYRMKTAQKTDVRVRIMNEIIQGIQVIKMYAWEKTFAKIIGNIRSEELQQIKGTLFIRGALFIFTIVSRFSIFVSLISYLYFGNIFTARKVFIITSYFNMLYSSMLLFWPVALISIAEILISIKRLQTFLLYPEHKPKIDFNKNNTNKTNFEGIDNLIKNKNLLNNDFLLNFNNKIENTNLNNSDENPMLIRNMGRKNINLRRSMSTEKRRVVLNTDTKGLYFKNTSAYYTENGKAIFTGIKSINLKINSGQLCAIVGPVGSGKSTLLQVVLGELEIDEGFVLINGTVSYASQEPWLFEGSVRSNILFTEEFDENRYTRVIEVCALQRDLELFPNGDMTIVGERGVSLSGGQRARINLARAIYRNADIYLLDDPLSAVDTHVGKHIFENCISSYLKDKVCVLVTHQLQYLKNVEHVVLLNLGLIESQGTYNSLKRNQNYLPITVGDEDDEKNTPYDEDEAAKSVEPINTYLDIHDDTNLIEKSRESQVTGAISFKIFISYFKAVQSNIFLIWVIVLFVCTQAAISGLDIIVSRWVNQEDKFSMILSNTSLSSTKHEEIKMKAEQLRHSHVILYSSLMGMLLLLTLQRSFSFFRMCLIISRNLHSKLFRSVTNATMYFFNSNTSGRILNRFSQDIGLIDTKLCITLVECINYFLEFGATIVVISIVNYWLLVPTLILSVFLYLIRYVYVRAARNIKRVESLTRSPIFSHANATLQGLSTIRALKAQTILVQEFDQHQNLNSSACFMFMATTRAFGLWLEFLCVIYVACVTFSFLIFENGVLSGNVGLALTQVINLVYMSQWGMRQTAELETHMTSVERILEYTDLKPESIIPEIDKNVVSSDKTEPDDPFKNWPSEGTIKFDNLSLKYSENDDYILKNVNFVINSKEKIGIVGRTGAGKSSIIQALFRLAINDGIIEIDGINTKDIDLDKLRNNISIIPQDPILFTGTLRTNLDPFEIKTDEEIWNVLNTVELKKTVATLPEGIHTKLSNCGSNFSMGQRQLVCLARAILRNNKILILDEATANVDPETDKLIQNTIRTKFDKSTVLTIAHRLHTVMDSDRVLVMDAGQCVEFDHPHLLLQNSNSKFKNFVDQTGSSMANRLSQIAEENYYNRTGLIITRL